MAKIDYAFSLEMRENMIAIEANECWINDILDKQDMFECIGEGCEAKIICKNMLTFPEERKVEPYFATHKGERHTDNCNADKIFKEKASVDENNISFNTSLNDEVAIFNIKRPVSDLEVVEIKEGVETEGGSKTIRSEVGTTNNVVRRIPKYSVLSSLIWVFIQNYDKGALNKKIKMNFPNGEIYDYKLSTLFKRIKEETEPLDEHSWKYKIYFGKGKIIELPNGKLYIEFDEKFKNSDKVVVCSITEKVIESTLLARKKKLNYLKNNIGRERYFYILSKCKINNEYNKVYLNTESLDTIAISDINVDESNRDTQ